jgi:ABC-type polysaccharide/polyol phosphate transport system ATPase subunit
VASITLSNVVVDFPIYGSQKSFRSELLGRATGGLIRREGPRQKRVSVRALDHISIHFEHGDRVGLIGHNGAGKSTLLRVLAGVYEPTSGTISVEGGVSPLFNASPGLDLEDTGYENIVTCGLFLGMSREEIDHKTPDIAKFSELGDYLSLPCKTYSTGMLTRLGFAIATALDPEILILDEGLGAGDARFAGRAAVRVKALVERASIMVLASHADALIQSMCNKAVLMEGGKIRAFAPVEEILEIYKETNRDTPAEAAASEKTA